MRGKDYINRSTGINARLSATGARKLTSNAAVMKSVNNGFTKHQHNALAANIDTLFEEAVMVEDRPDRNNDPNVKSIKRFVTAVKFGEMDAAAYITVKESTDKGHRIYSVEGITLETLSPPSPSSQPPLAATHATP